MYEIFYIIGNKYKVFIKLIVFYVYNVRKKWIVFVGRSFLNSVIVFWINVEYIFRDEKGVVVYIEYFLMLGRFVVSFFSL